MAGRSNSFVFPSRFHLVSPRLFHFTRLFRLSLSTHMHADHRYHHPSAVPEIKLDGSAVARFSVFVPPHALLSFSFILFQEILDGGASRVGEEIGRDTPSTSDPTARSSSVPRIRSNSNVRLVTKSPKPGTTRSSSKEISIRLSSTSDLGILGLNGMSSLQRPPQSASRCE